MTEFNKHLLGGKNELRNWSFEKLTADPTGGDLFPGRFWLDTALNIIKYYDGSSIQSVGSATPGGSNTHIQYNNGGTFAGDSNLTWDGDRLTITGGANTSGTDAETVLQRWEGSGTSNVVRIELSTPVDTSALSARQGLQMYASGSSISAFIDYENRPMGFFTSASPGVASEAMRIHTDQAISIGTNDSNSELDVNGTLTIGTPGVGARGDLPTIFGDDTAAFSRLFFSAQNNKNLSVIFTPQGTASQALFQINNTNDLSNRGRLLVWLDNNKAAFATDSLGSGTAITSLQLGEGDITPATTGNLTKIGFWFDKVEAARVDSAGNYYGNSFIKDGGTSLQFLKADGSIDSNVYLADAPSDGKIYGRKNSAWEEVISGGGSSTLSKGITIQSPTASEDIGMFFTPVAITVSEMRAVCQGTSPSVTWTVRHSTNRSATGNEVVTSGTTTTSTTTGSDVTTFDDATIPADSFVWLETTAVSGAIDDFHLTIVYTED